MSASESNGTQSAGPSLPLSAVGVVHRQIVHSRRVKVLSSHLAQLIPADADVLDVGCGDGLIDRQLMERRPDLRLTGLDVMVRPECAVPVVGFDGMRFPLADHSVDVVLFVDVLHHTNSPITLLREAVRVARACVVIKDHRREGRLDGLTLRLMDYLGNAPHGVVLPYSYLSTAQWAAALQKVGLTPVMEIDKLRLYPWPADLVFGRKLHFIGRYNVVRAS